MPEFVNIGHVGVSVLQKPSLNHPFNDFKRVSMLVFGHNSSDILTGIQKIIRIATIVMLKKACFCIQFGYFG